MSLVKSAKFSFRNQRNLISEMVRTDFKLRYQSSMLGHLWSIIKPLFLFAIMYTVFSLFLKIGAGIPNHPLSMLLGLVIWIFFAEATGQALSSIVRKGSLIRKITIPRYLVPIASTASAFTNMLLNLLVVFAFVAFASNTAVSWWTLLVVPLLLIELLALTLGVGLFLAAIYVKFRDINFIYDVIKQAMFYGTPIIWPVIYPAVRVPELVQDVIVLNPLVQIMQDARSVITYSEIPTVGTIHGPWMYTVPIGLTILTLVIGIVVFQKNSKSFAENV